MIPPKYLSVIAAILLAVLTAFVSVKTWNAYSEHDTIGRPPDVRDTITINGEGKMTSRPDIARVSLGMISEGRDVPTTQKSNTDQVNAITKAIEALGVKEQDIQTSNYQIFPQYDYTDGKQVLRGYQVSQTLDVKIRDLNSIGTILAKAGELGSNQVYGVTFDIDDPVELQREARIKAIEDANEKAKELAKQLGVNVVRVVGFYEDLGGVPPVPYFRGYAAEGMGGGEGVPDVKPGSFDVTSNVSITYEIR